jgi:hypothetical protein
MIYYIIIYNIILLIMGPRCINFLGYGYINSPKEIEYYAFFFSFNFNT